MPPQLEKNHVVPMSSQDGALARYGVSRDPIGIFWGALQGYGCLDLVEQALSKAGADGGVGRRDNLPAHLLGGGLVKFVVILHLETVNQFILMH